MPERLTSECYRILERRELPQPVSLPDDWLNQLGERMGQAQGYTEEATSRLKAALHRHAGESSSYSSKTNLSQLLKILYQGYSAQGGEAFDPEFKKAVPQQIYEVEPESCTEGFHDRVASVVAGLTFTESLDGFLMQIREGIVDATTRQRTDEVHAHHQFRTVAFHGGYGIQDLRTSDRYTGAVPIETIQADLAASFKRNYQPLSILKKLFYDIKGRMGHVYGYHGRDEAGYAMDDYDKFNRLLIRVGLPVGSAADYLICDEETYAVTDLNWVKIRQDLFKILCDRRYFHLSVGEKTALDALFASQGEPAPTTNLAPLFAGEEPFIKDRDALIQLLSSVDKDSNDLKLNLIKAYVSANESAHVGVRCCDLLTASDVNLPPIFKNRILATYHEQILAHIIDSEPEPHQVLIKTVMQYPKFPYLWAPCRTLLDQRGCLAF